MGFNQEIRIGNRMIGPDHPTFFIAEIGGNFDGSKEKAKRLLTHFKKFENIVKATKEELLEVQSITNKDADAIIEYFKNKGTV